MNQQNGINVKFSDDKMKAAVSLSSAAGQFNAVSVVAELVRYGIVHGLNTALIHKMVAESVFDKFVEVAHGTHARRGSDARIEIFVDLSSAGRFSDFINVTAGAHLVRRIPPVPGIDGMDVFGNVLKLPPVKDIPLLSGQGTAVDPKDPNLLLASRAGSFTRLSDGTVEVRQSRKIDGNIDAGTGSISFPGDLIITGSVFAGFSVEVAGSLKILGDVGDAVIRCRGDMILRTGVRGGGNAMVVAGKSIKVRYLEKVKLTAAQDVFVTEDIIESKINCKGVVRARSIVGGSVTAASGIYVKHVGSKAGVRTILDVGALCNYEKEHANLVDCINAQNMMNEGCVSELFCFVRDNMDENGVIAEDKLPDMNQFVENLLESINIRREFEKSLEGIEGLLKTVSDSMIVAEEVYPNVLMRLGYTEHLVKDMLTNVSVKPGESVNK
ncbi:MAG: FapA family protein [Chitinispirillales bacterium]|jgi:uncharacterized protein (DUF342 family)|nr:FapA family protein [Chitinispirillales bacterium]